jgi:hypothetical protein
MTASAVVVSRQPDLGMSVRFRSQGLQLRIWPGDVLHVYDLAGHTVAELPAEWVFRAVLHYLDGHLIAARFADELARPGAKAAPRDAETWEAPPSFVLGARRVSRAALRARRRSRAGKGEE